MSVKMGGIISASARPGKVFILSPAHCGGERAQLLLREAAQFPLARQMRSRTGASLAAAFTFLSGLYFRGKMAYVNAFAPPATTLGDVASLCASPDAPAAFVITTNRGLLHPDTVIRLRDLKAMGCGDIHPDDEDYRRPLERDIKQLAAALNEDHEVVLLGSIAEGKYCDILLKFFGKRLLFPQEFIGRGDMSRGGLMLRCADDHKELTYIPVQGAVRRGKRPPRLVARAPLKKASAP